MVFFFLVMFVRNMTTCHTQLVVLPWLVKISRDHPGAPYTETRVEG